jgi:hypothetical protein
VRSNRDKSVLCNEVHGRRTRSDAVEIAKITLSFHERFPTSVRAASEIGILRFLAKIFFNDGFRGECCNMQPSIGKLGAKLWIDCGTDPIASALVSNIRGGQGQFAALGRGTALLVTDMDIRVPAKAAATRLEETLRPSGDG